MSAFETDALWEEEPPESPRDLDLRALRPLDAVGTHVALWVSHAAGWCALGLSWAVIEAMANPHPEAAAEPGAHAQARLRTDAVWNALEQAVGEALTATLLEPWWFVWLLLLPVASTWVALGQRGWRREAGVALGVGLVVGWWQQGSWIPDPAYTAWTFAALAGRRLSARDALLTAPLAAAVVVEMTAGVPPQGLVGVPATLAPLGTSWGLALLVGATAPLQLLVSALPAWAAVWRVHGAAGTITLVEALVADLRAATRRRTPPPAPSPPAPAEDVEPGAEGGGVDASPGVAGAVDEAEISLELEPVAETSLELEAVDDTPWELDETETTLDLDAPEDEDAGVVVAASSPGPAAPAGPQPGLADPSAEARTDAGVLTPPLPPDEEVGELELDEPIDPDR